MPFQRSLAFGALAPSLREQLAGMFPRKDLARFDMLALAVTRLHVNSLISDKEAHAARKRLLKLMEVRQKELLGPKKR